MDNQQESLKLIPIPFKETYFATVDGQVYSFKFGKPRLLKQRKHKARGSKLYKVMRLGERPTYLVHRVIASILVGRELNKDEVVNHKDGNTENNSLNNLEVVSHRENVKHAVANNLYCSGKDWYLARGIFNDYPEME